jgi:hypothetical protein
MKKIQYHKPEISIKKVKIRFFNKRRVPGFDGPTYLSAVPEC